MPFGRILDGVPTIRERELEHELALARASSTYWRERYIDVCNRALYLPELSDAIKNARYWYGRAARTPIDECYG